MKLKKFSREFHIYVSVFLLPMALLFAITGVIYILGVNQDFGASKDRWVLEEVVPQDKQFDYLIDFMQKHDIAFPKDLTPKKIRGILVIGTAKYAVSIATQEGKTIIQSVKRSFLGNMIMLHKAKAKWYFDVLSIAFGIALVLFYVSGVIMTAFCKSNRKEIIITFVIGLVITAILAYVSL